MPTVVRQTDYDWCNFGSMTEVGFAYHVRGVDLKHSRFDVYFQGRGDDSVEAVQDCLSQAESAGWDVSRVRTGKNRVLGFKAIQLPPEMNHRGGRSYVFIGLRLRDGTNLEPRPGEPIATLRVGDVINA